ncbi:MAG: PHB depolymerase family esterase [Polyangiaceae bacterium]
MTLTDPCRPVLGYLAFSAAVLLGCRSNSPTQGSQDGVTTTHRQPATLGASGQSGAAATREAAPLERRLLEDQLVFPERPQNEPMPFILFLHGFGSSGASLKQALLLSRVAERYGFAYAAPSGPTDSHGRRFWNADGCCDFEHTGADHVRALLDLLHRAASDPRIDSARLYAYGFSNGGYMAHQLACVPSTPLAGIVSVAGAPPTREEFCRPDKPLAIVQVHGDEDRVVPFGGGFLLEEPSYPRVEAIMKGLNRWATALGCANAHDAVVSSLDLLPEFPGRETTRTFWARCRGTLALYFVKGGTHSNVTAIPLQVAALMTMMGHDVTPAASQPE